MTSMPDESQTAQYRGFRNNRRPALIAGLVGLLLILIGSLILHWDHTRHAALEQTPPAHE